MQKAYKIFEVENGEIKNLFRGINKSRTLSPEVWHKAEIKLGRDGSESRWYKTGIHCLPSREQAEEYLQNFRVPRNRIIVEVWVKGDRRKPTNPAVILADELFIPAQQYLEVTA